jgi:predicted GH43/DUF377 family glycosyl hydrolase
MHPTPPQARLIAAYASPRIHTAAPAPARPHAELRVPGQVTRLQPTIGTHAFNGTVLPAWADRLLAIFRAHRRPSQIAICPLSPNLQPGPAQILWELSDPAWIPEDPVALFHDGRLLVMYTAITAHSMQAAAMFLAEIGPDYRVRSKDFCHYEQARQQEKNWSPFTQAGRLYCLYEHQPHTILRFDHDRIEWRLSQARETELTWPFGESRGGAPPVWHAGRWYVFFHSSRFERRRDGRTPAVYYAGCYAADADWNILAISREPILAADPNQAHHPWGPGGDGVAAVFPRGAFVDRDDWVLSYGYLDSELRTARIATETIDRLLDLPTAAPATHQSQEAA